MRISSSPLAPLTPLTYYVLVALKAKPSHAYALMRQVAQDSSGAVSPTMGSLHNILSTLRSRSYIESPTTTGPKATPLYQLTPLGTKVFELELERLKRAVYIGNLAQRGLPNK